MYAQYKQSTMAFNFAGKVAIVTGSSSGMGEVFAIRLAKLGAKVTLTGRNEKNLKLSAEKCDKASGGGHADRFQYVAGDITTKETRKKVLDATMAKFGKLDILIPNHGLSLAEDMQFQTVDEGSWDRLMNTNLKSVFFFIQEATEALSKSRGCIVCMSSLATSMVMRSTFVYSISKAGLDYMIKCLALELASKGIRVNAIQPGNVATNLMRDMAAKSQMDGKALADQVQAAEAKNQILHGRTATPDEIADILLFLANNEASSFVTGVTMPCSAGREFLGYGGVSS